jgi:hypothetical protein
MGRRRRHQRVLLPGEREGRRGFLKKGLLGAALLAVGGAGWLATRKTRPAAALGGPFQVLSPEEATVVLALADRLVPERAGFPRPREVGVPRKVDAIVGMTHPATQEEVRRLLRLFENALAGLLLDGQLRTFTGCAPAAQDARIRAWARSRLALRRTGYRALTRLVYAAYYASPETYGALGYPGPPIRRAVEAVPAAPAPPMPTEEPEPEPPEARAEEPASPPPPARPVEVVPAPRSGLAPPEEAPRP